MQKAMKDLLASASVRKWSDEADLDQWLTEHKVTDVEMRISLKHYLESIGRFSHGGHRLNAQGLATDQAQDYRMATDDALYTPPVGRPVSSHMARWLSRAGLDLTKQYTIREVDEALARVEFDVERRMQVKAELADRGCLRASAEPQGHRLQASAAKGTKIPGTLSFSPLTFQP